MMWLPFLRGGDTINKRQKEVLEYQLEEEKKIIRELEKQYAAALKDINEKVKLFQTDIDLLDEALSQDGLDDAAKVLLKSQKQSKIYQKQFQQALKGQISGIIDKMHGDNYATIDKYLNGCYETGFIGTLYDIAGQGIPLVVPIDQAAVVKAVLTDSRVSNGLYIALGVDVRKLKKSITQEISRGIASGLPYRDIARNLKNTVNIPLYNAKRIVRTESHRIQQQSTEESRKAASKRGADVVRMWDSSLDGRTRDSHRRVDGEIRELDEKFSNGLMFPGDPSGGAAEVINCRCVALTRARWALDEDELQTLKERAEYFGLDKTKNFEDYKGKYLKAVEKPENGSIIKSIKVDDIKAAVSGGAIKEEVAVRIADVLETHNASYLFDKATTKKLGNSIVFQTEPQKVGTFFDVAFIMNEDVLGGKSIAEIDAMFSAASNTISNNMNDAVIHEMYHSKLIRNLNYAQLESLYDELNSIHIEGLGKTAMIDGSECIAEVGVLIERGETDKAPQKAIDLFERFLGKI